MMRNIFVDDWFDRGYERGVTQGISKGISIGISQGAHDKAVETARALLADGDTVEKASRISGLPLAEIQQIAQEIQVRASAR